MSRGLKFVRQVVGQVRMSNEDFDNDERIKTEDVRNSASAVVEIRRLKAENEAQVRISSLEHDLVEIEGLHDGVDELVDAQAQVTEMKEAMESYLEKGGLTRDAARFAEIAMKNITSRVFMPMAMPSLESFSGSSADRTDMTIVSMEAADSWYAKVWEAIKNFFKKIIDKVKSWFGKSKEDSEKSKSDLLERIKQLRDMERANNAKAADQQDKYGFAKGAIKDLRAKGVFPGAEIVPAGSDVTEEEKKGKLTSPTDIGGNTSATKAYIGSLIKSASDIVAKFDPAVIKQLAGDTTVSLGDNKKGAALGNTVYVGFLKPRLIESTTTGDNATTTYALSEVTIASAPDAKDADADVEQSLSDSVKVLEHYADIYDEIIGVEDKIKSVYSRAEAEIENKYKNATNGKDITDDQKKAAKKEADDARSVLKIITSGPFAASVISKCKAAMQAYSSKCATVLKKDN